MSLKLVTMIWTVFEKDLHYLERPILKFMLSLRMLFLKIKGLFKKNVK